MMKRLPKGTLKVTTSSLDGREAHVKSKRVTLRGGTNSGKSQHHQLSTTSSSASTGTSRTVRSFKTAPALVSPTTPAPPNQVSGTSSTSGTSSAGGAHHPATSFHFLRRPFITTKSRKSSSVTKHMKTHAEVSTIETTETSDDTGSNTSNRSVGVGANNKGDGVLGIAAAPSFVTVVQDTVSTNVVELVLNESTMAVVSSESPTARTDDDTGVPTTAPITPCGSPFQSSEGEESPISPIIAGSPSSDDGNHHHVLGIQRPCYDFASTIVSPNHDHDRSAFSFDGNNNNNPDDDDAEQESEIVFEKEDDQELTSSSSLFEQSWLNDSELVPVLDPPVSSPSEKRRQEPRDNNVYYQPYAQYSSAAGFSPTTSRLQEECSSSSVILPSLQGGSMSSYSPKDKKGSSRSSSISSKNRDIAKEKSPSSSKRDSRVNSSWASRSTTGSPRTATPSVKIFVLLLQPRNKIFELIQLTYPAETTTVGAILEMIPPHATEPALSNQVYVGLTRPKKRSPDFCDAKMYASCTSHNSNCVGFQSGETILAIPQGYGHHDLVRLAKKILANPRIQQLLERSSSTTTSHHHHHRHSGGSSRASQTSKSYQASSQSSVNHDGQEQAHQEEDQDSKSAYEEGMKRAMANASVANAAVTSRSVSSRTPSKSSSVVSKTLPPTSVDAFLAKQHQKLQRLPFSPTTASTSSCTMSKSSVVSGKKLLPAPTKDSPKKQEQTRLLYSRSSSTTSAASSSAMSKSSVSKCMKRSSGADGMAKEPASATTTTFSSPHPTRPLASRTNSATDSVSSSTVSSGARNRQHSVKSPKSLLGECSEALDTISMEGDPFEQFSQSRAARKRSRSRQKRRASFAPLVISSPSRSVCSASTLRSKRNKQRVAFVVSSGRAMALMFLTMIIRYYCDPKATKLQRCDYDQPLGILGGLQLFLLLHVLIKLQYFCSGAVNAINAKEPSSSSSLLLDRQLDSSSVSSSRSRLG